jgi:hypothetical protein
VVVLQSSVHGRPVNPVVVLNPPGLDCRFHRDLVDRERLRRLVAALRCIAGRVFQGCGTGPTYSVRVSGFLGVKVSLVERHLLLLLIDS